MSKQSCLGFLGRSRFGQRRRILSLIRTERIDAYLQPLADVHTGRIIGYESLARPASLDRFESIVDLFEAAHRAGLGPALDAAARRPAFRIACRLPESTLLFLNCTPDTLTDPQAVRLLARAVRRARLDPGRLVLELTEIDLRRTDLDAAARHVRAEGMKLALDDVGAGANGLGRLLALRPDWLKLDRSLIQRLHNDPVAHELVRALVRFASSTGMKVVGEGVESPRELRLVRALGIGYAQGYLIGRPAAPDIVLSPEVRAGVRLATLAAA